MKQNSQVKTRYIRLTIVFILFLILLFGLSFLQGPLEAMKTKLEVYPLLGPFMYTSLVAISIVIMPLSIMPLIPFAASLWGPPVTALYSIIGWTIGAVVAFLIARYLGKPVLRYFISLEKLESYEKRVPENVEFLAVVLLRMAIPVDILSYALGFFSKISFGKYTLATLIGVAPFSFIWAYAGKALVLGNYFAASGFVLFIVLSLWILHRFILKKTK